MEILSIMYITHFYKVNEEDKIIEFIKSYNFGIISTYDHQTDQIFSTHLPFTVLKEEKIHLYAHFAKANIHWEIILSNPKVQVIFLGPHAYISPTYYKSPNMVPTWL